VLFDISAAKECDNQELLNESIDQCPDPFSVFVFGFGVGTIFNEGREREGEGHFDIDDLLLPKTPHIWTVNT